MTRFHVRSASLLISLMLVGCHAKDQPIEEPFDADSPDQTAAKESRAETEDDVVLMSDSVSADLNQEALDPVAMGAVHESAEIVPKPQGTQIEFESVAIAPSLDAAADSGSIALSGRGIGGGGSAGGMIGYRMSSRGGVAVGAASMAKKRRPHAHRAVAPPPPVRESITSSEEYTDHGVNPFTVTAKDAKSTFSIDVDTASYTMSRRKLKSGVLPAWEGVRAEEFINFFEYDYQSPRSGPFAVHMEAMPDPLRANSHVLRVGVQAKRFKPSERPPLHLTFLVDVSGSMSSADKLGLAKTSMHTLVDNLREGDTVAMATYAGRTARVLEPTSVDDARRIHAAIDSLHSGGSTAMSSGIELAYDMADDAFEKGAENRVIILSDGDANVGSSSWKDMLSQIKGYADQGITLSTIGYGQGNYRDTLMEQLANKGDGNNFYVDSAKESDRLFGEKIGGTMITVARDTKIQVEFNPDAVESYRLIGYENRDIADKDFRNDRVDAGEVGSGHSVTALYEVVLADDSADELATVRVRWEEPGADKEASEQAFKFGSRDMKRSSRNASEDTRLAYAAATFAEVLRQSPHAADVDLADLRTMIADMDGDKDVRELTRLIGTAERLGAMDAQSGWQAKN